MRVQHFAERRHARLEKACKSFGLAPGDEKLRFGVAQDVGLARGVLGDAVGAERRIDRHRNSAGEKDSGEGGEEFGAGRKHDRDSLAGFEAAAAEFVGSVNGGNHVVPTLKFADGSTLTNPAANEITAKLAQLAG